MAGHKMSERGRVEVHFLPKPQRHLVETRQNAKLALLTVALGDAVARAAYLYLPRRWCC